MDKDKIVETTLDDNIVAYLLSYPKSGNSWLRYIIEYMTGIPTIYEGNMRSPIPGVDIAPAGDSLLWQTTSITADAFHRMGTLSNPHIDYPISAQPQCPWRKERMKYDKGLILKKHFAADVGSGHPLDPAINEESKLILLIRDPRDCSVRHLGESWKAHAASAKLYVEYPGPKMIAYYEDLVNVDSVEKVILEIVTFLDGSPNAKEDLDKFMKDYETHVKTSAQTYQTFGGGKSDYKTKTLSEHYKPYKTHHLSTAKGKEERNKRLLNLCEGSIGGEIFQRYREKR